MIPYYEPINSTTHHDIPSFLNRMMSTIALKPRAIMSIFVFVLFMVEEGQRILPRKLGGTIHRGSERCPIQTPQPMYQPQQGLR